MLDYCLAFSAYITECYAPGEQTGCSVTCGNGTQKTCSNGPDGSYWRIDMCDTNVICPCKLLT